MALSSGRRGSPWTGVGTVVAKETADHLSGVRMVVIEALVDPHEPPMPPKVKAEQALHFAESLARGTPHRGKIALTVASDTVRELV